jgi:tellurite resistance protein TerC
MSQGIGTPLSWGVFLALIAVLLLLDLGVIHRKAHRVGFREALLWTAVWVGLSFAFNAWIYLEHGSQPALEYLAGYVIEKSLSMDNIFVFVVIFKYFAVPEEYQHRVLFWGILGAVVLRGVFIALGTALITNFHWVIYVFGAFLVVTGLRFGLKEETEVHPERNPVVALVRRLVPLTSRYHGPRLILHKMGRTYATPLLLVLVVVETTDVIFAVDSIPAIFAITLDPFLVFTSNIFAILGLRALYFLLADLVGRFSYLRYGLALVLVFVGAKMLLSRIYEIPVEISLGVVLLTLMGSMLLSWWKSRHLEEPGSAE